MSLLRKFVRRNTPPIPQKKATRWRSRLSIAYAVVTWNLLGFIAYEYYKGRGTKEAYGLKTDEYDMLSPAQKFAVTTGVEKAKIIRSKTLDAQEFKLEDYQHILVHPVEVEEKIEEKDADNVYVS